MVVLWGSALLSAVLDNIPFVIVMMPLIQKMLVSNGVAPTGDNPLFWALALGACLGGNGTIIGASANVIVSKIGERNGYHISFMQFIKWGVPFMVQSVLIAMVYLWLRYFV
jgi:Na+/H+ antiporter NhaD/arsenite permease-like protein